MADLGTRMIQHLMPKKRRSLPDLMKTAADCGVEIVICEMSINLMGFKEEELIDYPNITLAGVTKFLQETGKSKLSLFI